MQSAIIRIPLNTIDPEELFGNEAAEMEDAEIFFSYALERGDFSSLHNANSKIKILTAFKGEGKSAAIRLIQNKCAGNNDRILVSINASDVAPDTQTDDESVFQKDWKKIILRSIADTIGSTINMAWSDDSTTLVELAERNSFKEKSLVGYVTERLSSKYKILERDNLEAGLDKRLKRYLSQKDMTIWVVIDDIDHEFQNTARWKAKIAGLLNSCKVLQSTIPSLRFRLTLRPNIWKILSQEFASLSHFRQYRFDITWSEDDIVGLLASRITGYYKRQRGIDIPLTNSSSKLECIELVFKANLDWGNKSVHPHIVLDTLSKNRPRWLIELGKIALKVAKKNKQDSVRLEDIISELNTFGNNRIDDMVAEYKSQCPDLDELIAYFKSQEKTYTTQQLLDLLQKRVLPKISPRIYGIVGTPNASDVARFLFYIGFISARFTQENGQYEHVLFSEDSNLLFQDQASPEGLTWEIHPVFVTALNMTNKRPVSGAKLTRK